MLSLMLPLMLSLGDSLKMTGKIPYKTILITCFSGAALFHCRPSTKTPVSDVEQYIDQNQLWAVGQVKLGDASQVPDIFIKTANQRPNGQVQGTSGTVQKTAFDQSLGNYQLIGRVAGEEKDVAIVDYHPTENKLLSYIYGLEVIGSKTGQWTVYGRLYKTPKFARRSMVVLGTLAGMPSDQPQKIQIASNLNRSVIVEGAMLGYWALHVPEVQKTIVKPWLGICPRQDVIQTAQGPLVVGQSSTTQTAQIPGQSVGQNPLQGPAQGNVCRSLSADLDLCGGNPLAPGCVPQIDPAILGSLAQKDRGDSIIRIEVIKGAAKVTGRELSYVMDKAVEYAQFVVDFPKIAVQSESENNDYCNKGLLSVQKTVGGMGNPTCSVTVIPSTPRSFQGSAGVNPDLKQSLRCSIQVQVKNPTTFLERVCQLGFELRPALLGAGTSPIVKNEDFRPQINENLRELFGFQVLVRP